MSRVAISGGLAKCSNHSFIVQFVNCIASVVVGNYLICMTFIVIADPKMLLSNLGAFTEVLVYVSKFVFVIHSISN